MKKMGTLTSREFGTLPARSRSADVMRFAEAGAKMFSAGTYKSGQLGEHR